jgi:ABC-type phosphate transport system permease subunit
MFSKNQGATVMTNPITPEPNPYAAPTYGSSSSDTPKSPVLSIISLITGILGVVSGFFGWGLLFSIAAVVLGHLGKKKEPAARGFWLTGLITGYVGIAINVIVLAFAIIATIAIISNPNLVNQ